MSEERLIGVARHEAAHAAAFLHMGLKFWLIQFSQDGGVVEQENRFDREDDYPPPTEVEGLVARLAGAVADIVGHEAARVPRDLWELYERESGALRADYIDVGQAVASILDIPFDQEDPPSPTRFYDGLLEHHRDQLDAWQRDASDILRGHWSLICAIGNELVDRYTRKAEAGDEWRQECEEFVEPVWVPTNCPCGQSHFAPPDSADDVRKIRTYAGGAGSSDGGIYLFYPEVVHVRERLGQSSHP